MEIFSDKVEAEETNVKSTVGKHKLETTDERPSTSSSSSCTAKKPDHQEVPSKKAKSIQNDPSTSKVFKSLFTSSESGKTQPRAHWVTYNPLYY